AGPDQHPRVADGVVPRPGPAGWPKATRRVREQSPDFCFMAEVYWDLEWALQQQEFNYAYDKRLYDRLRDRHARPINQELAKFYDRLLGVLRRPAVCQGEWQLLECVPAWEGNWTWDCFLAFAWHVPGEDRVLVTVNYT